MKACRQRSGFTLVEVLIVIVIMAILAGAIIPKFSNSTADAKNNTAKFNINTLRSQIEFYRAQHDVRTPSMTLAELTSATSASGTIGTGVTFPYGPYVQSVPLNPITNSNAIVAPATVPPVAAIADAGYLYDVTSGKIWINDPNLTLLSY